MTFIDVVRQLERFDDDQTIFLDRSCDLTSASLALVSSMSDVEATPEDTSKMKCFLDVWHAKEVIDGKARQRNISSPTDEQKVDLLVEYALNGA